MVWDGCGEKGAKMGANGACHYDRIRIARRDGFEMSVYPAANAIISAAAATFNPQPTASMRFRLTSPEE